MPSLKIILRYCLGLFAGYGLLLWLGWLPAVAKSAAGAFHQITMPAVEQTHSDLTIYSKPSEGDQFYNYKIRFISTAEIERQKALAIQQGKSRLDLSGGTVLELKYHQIFFNPWFFLLCLTLVTPLTWQRKVIALLLGSCLFWLFALGKIHLIIQQQATANGSGTLVDILVSPGFVSFVVLAIWALAAFRKSNWRHLLKKSE